MSTDALTALSVAEAILLVIVLAIALTRVRQDWRASRAASRPSRVRSPPSSRSTSARLGASWARSTTGSPRS
jgi:hypothetical protein